MSNKIYPFKFLDSYTAEDKDIFFGRTQEIKQLYEMIYQSDILLLYGASGTGKTSLIQCGLASQFKKHDWLEVFIRRHKNINESLHKSLILVGGQKEESTKETENLDWLNDLMEDNEGDVPQKTLSQVQIFLKNIYLKHFRPIYLIFDQFEELFILGSQEEQALFINTVQEILKVDQPVKLIFSIREEYLGSLYEFEKMVPELLRKKLRIDPMNLEKVKDVVLGATQSKKSIVHINETEAEAISEQVFEKIRGKEKSLTIQLPYLQVFLDKFYRHISKDKAKIPTTEATYTLKSLAEIGTISNILRDFLDEQIIEISSNQDCERKTIWKILSPFVTIDGTKEPTSIDSLDQIFPDIPKKLIEHVVIALMNNRILRYIEEEELYEITHDSLALRIAEKRSDDEIALLEVRNLIKSQSLLKDEARELFSEKQLDFIDPFLKRLKLNLDETQLIEESKSRVLQIQEEATRKRRISKISVLAFILTLLVFLGFSLRQQKKAEKLQKEAEDANKVSKKIIASMDFYGGKYALAFKDGKYGFIDTNGDEIIDYEYDKGEPFDIETGFAEMEIEEVKEIEKTEKVKIEDNKYTKYLIDTSGNRYWLVNISKELKDGGNTDDKKENAKKKKRKKRIKIKERIKNENTKLISTLNKDGNQEWLALDFSGTTRDDINNTLKFIIKENSIKDRVHLLFLNGADLEKLPNSISNFKNLQQLDLSRTAIPTLPLSFKKLTYLVKLNLSDTKLKSISESITKLKNLEVLDLSGTELEAIPESIGELKNLRELYLSGPIEIIPKSIVHLKFLETLDLLNTKIKKIPESIGTLDSLKELSLTGPIEIIPPSIIHLKNLETLDLFDTKLKTIPESIFSLKNLRELYISDTIETIPPSIGKLENLRELYLTGPIESIPDSIVNLKKLEILDLSSTKLKTIPQWISKLESLETLDITKNEYLEAIPDISKYKKLKYFYITLYEDENYSKNKTALERLKAKAPDCYFGIIDEKGNAVELIELPKPTKPTKEPQYNNLK